MAAVYTQGVDMYILELEESCTVINPHSYLIFFQEFSLGFFRTSTELISSLDSSTSTEFVTRPDDIFIAAYKFSSG